MMEKIMSDMFDEEDGMEQMGEFDRKSGFQNGNQSPNSAENVQFESLIFYLAQAVLNGDVDPLEVDDEEFEGEEATEDPEDGDGAIRDEL